MTAPVTLASEAVDAIARRVVELLAEQRTPIGEHLVDAAQLAELLGVERGWVYDNADALGAIRLGAGDRPRLRFSVERALAAWQQRERHTEPEPEPEPERTTTRRRTTTARTDLLPVRGHEAA